MTSPSAPNAGEDDEEVGVPALPVLPHDQREASREGSGCVGEGGRLEVVSAAFEEDSSALTVVGSRYLAEASV